MGLQGYQIESARSNSVATDLGSFGERLWA